MDIKDIEKRVDEITLNRQKPKRSKKKYIMVAVVLIIGAFVARGALLTYIGEFQTTMHVEQSIVFDGQNWDEPVMNTIENATGGCCNCSEHWVENRGCEGVWLDFDEWALPDMEGIYTHYYLSEGCCCEHILETLELEVLDGMAEWDDFAVQVDGTLVYTYDAVGGDPETWIMHTIDLTPFEIQCCGTHTIRIICTACEPWEHFDTYGQLAVNYGALYCEGEVLCDEVDIGNPTSESGHNLLGWGPVEPANSGGEYGGINDCRCTWYDDNDDTSEARFELTCEDCYEQGGCPEECEEGTPLDMPFYIEPGQRIDFCICYKLDMFIMPDTYEIFHQLVPVVD